MSLRDRIYKEASEGGFRRHPNGTFPAEVIEVKEKDWEGQALIEIWLETPEGKTKKSIWVCRMKDIDGRLLERAKNRAEAEEWYCNTLSQVVRLYKDLGLRLPEGNSDEEFENEAWGRLGELTGRKCVVVIENSRTRKDKSGNPEQNVYVNAPKDGAVVQANGSRVQAPPPPTAFSQAATPQNLDDIPF